MPFCCAHNVVDQASTQAMHFLTKYNPRDLRAPVHNPQVIVMPKVSFITGAFEFAARRSLKECKASGTLSTYRYLTNIVHEGYCSVPTV
jgi:hypothetical protein